MNFSVNSCVRSWGVAQSTVCDKQLSTGNLYNFHQWIKPLYIHRCNNDFCRPKPKRHNYGCSREVEYFTMRPRYGYVAAVALTEATLKIEEDLSAQLYHVEPGGIAMSPLLFLLVTTFWAVLSPGPNGKGWGVWERIASKLQLQVFGYSLHYKGTLWSVAITTTHTQVFTELHK